MFIALTLIAHFSILDCRFRLAELQFIAIQKLDSPGSIEQGLRRLPRGITKMYDYFLQEQGENKLATLRILQMVLYSSRQVSPEEVAEILGVNALHSEKPVFKVQTRSMPQIPYAGCSQ